MWATERLLDSARSLLFPLYASLFTPVWLRALGAKIGRGVEASTVLLLPRMTEVGDGAFLADDTMIASYELGGGWLCIEAAKVGKRAFLGNSGMAAPGPRGAEERPGRGAVGRAGQGQEGHVLAGQPAGAAAPLGRRRQEPSTDVRPAAQAQAGPRAGRAVPAGADDGHGRRSAAGVLLALEALVGRGRLSGGRAGLGRCVLLAAGAVAGAITSAAKWLLVGRTRAVEYPLWSSFVWRNEVVDTFVEMVAAPWFARAASGTSVLNLWLRDDGRPDRAGRLVRDVLAAGGRPGQPRRRVTVNRGCVLQTHLFHDRILRMDTVALGDGADAGPARRRAAGRLDRRPAPRSARSRW